MSRSSLLLATAVMLLSLSAAAAGKAQPGAANVAAAGVPKDGEAPRSIDTAWRAYLHAAATPTPSRLFGALYAEVEMRGLFPDNKVFADAQPRRDIGLILSAYKAGAPWTDQALKQFVLSNFVLPDDAAPAAAAAMRRASLGEHIAGLWPSLIRFTPHAPQGGSALGLPNRYVVPGGRFRELYYWDSYFTMLGLAEDGRADLVESMIDDFGALIERYGHIPNGARTYYLTRSQTPLFYAMVGLSRTGDPIVRARRIGWMKQEHAFWMAGEQGLKPGHARLHVVAMPDGAVLNRYFDIAETPRDESYSLDVRLAARSGRSPAEVYANVRAAAESGWDFSSRWFADGRTLESIDTASLVEPDLNSLLYGLEREITVQCRHAGDIACAERFAHQAEARVKAMRRWMWDEPSGVYRDYNWRLGRHTASDSAATLYPLFSGFATPAEAQRIGAFVRSKLLGVGGLRTTTVQTGQQWDRPNGWAPLQWIAVQGLKRYGQIDLANDIACRWLKTVEINYSASGKLVEKYDVESSRPGGGGEYPLQDGFGWTNGVSAALRCDASISADTR